MTDEQPRLIDWEHVAFVAVMLAFVVWYVTDSATASPTFSNLILIGPVAGVAVCLLVYIGALEVSKRRPAAASTGEHSPTDEKAPSRFRSGSIRSILLLMGLFGLFVLIIPYLGFEVASFLFIVVTLPLLGERRVGLTLAIALALSAAISATAIGLFTVPVPLTVAPLLWRLL